MKKQRNEKRVGWIAVAAIVALGALLTAVLWHTGMFAALSSVDDLRAYMQQREPYTWLLFFAVQLASVILAPIPSNLTSAAGAALIGALPAFLLTYAAVVGGSCLAFWLSRLLGQKFTARFVQKKTMEKYTDLIRRKRDSFFAVAFLLPGFPDDILCFLAGLTEMPFRRFLALVALFRPWGLAVACAVGGQALNLPLWAMGALCVIYFAVICIALRFGDRWEAAILQRLRKEKT